MADDTILERFFELYRDEIWRQHDAVEGELFERIMAEIEGRMPLQETTAKAA